MISFYFRDTMCTSGQRQGGHRSSNYGRLACEWLKKLLALLHGLFDILVDYAFGLYYNDTTRKIAQVNGVLNAVVDERYNDALEEARAADKLIESGEWEAENLKIARPFHGVPFTTKESTAVKGLHHSIGLLCRRNVIATEDAEVVVLMRRAGAIPLALTNIPELCMWYETRCNVYGQTNNPYDTNRMVGGSSGGESSLLAACGSPFGIGSDIGGSIRMPAFFCGIFGHKPTTGTTPLRGLSRRVGGEVSMAVAGPMSKHAEDLLPSLAILVDVSQLRICYMEDDGGDLLVSPVCRELNQSMQKAISHLREITKEPPKKIYLPGMKHSRKLWRHMLTKEPEKLAEELTNREGAVIWWAEIVRMLFGHSEYTLPSVLRLIDLKLPQVKPQWAEEKLKALLEDLKVTSHPYPALYHYAAFLRPYNYSYSAVINALNIPATQVPLGLSKNGLPLGVQVVAAPFNDRLCLAVAEELERRCGGWVPPFKTS
ncbi:hypothetical protein B566_EDAN012632 [Ephemera danica]|nr:hypothetical protein B566_EDAN012632 [Ephemera danica]